MPVEPFSFASLSAADRQDAVTLARTSLKVLMSAMLNRARPSAVELSDDPASLERQAASIVSALDDEVFDDLRPRLDRILNDNELKESFMPSDLVVVSPSPTVAGFVRPSVSGLTGRATTQPSPSRYKNLHMNLRAIHCIDEANWGGFEYNRKMYLVSSWIGASGNIDSHKAIYLGKHIDDGDYMSYGERHLGKFSLSTTNSYPKTFYWHFMLLDSNASTMRSISRITDTVTAGIQAVGSAAGAKSVAAIAGALGPALNSLLDALIFERAWPVYGVRIKVYSENDFGSDGVINRHTRSLTAYNGKYRIGYQLAFV